MIYGPETPPGYPESPANRKKSRNPKRDAFIAGGLLAFIGGTLAFVFVVSEKESRPHNNPEISAAGWIGERSIQPDKDLAPPDPSTKTESEQNAPGEQGPNFAPTKEETQLQGQAEAGNSTNKGKQIKQGTVQRGIPVIKSLTELGLSTGQAHGLIASLSGIFDFKTARPGQSFELHVDPATDEPSYFRYDVSLTEVYEVKRQGQEMVGSRKHIPTVKKAVRYGGTISSSLYKAIGELGAHPSLPGRIVDVLTNQVDFFKAQRPGDTFRVITEEERLDDTFISYGPLLALEYNGVKSGKKRLFLFEKDGEPTYFDEKGVSVPKTMLSTPLHYTRISSQFGKRYHPILKRSQFHSGVDYAAPQGAPIWACKSGTVTFAATKGANGKLVIVDHGENLKSYYAHLSRFAPGIKSGVKVRRRQVIGYVGSTGRSTGPHLHFGVKLRGQFIDPLKYKVLPGKPVAPKYRQELRSLIAKRSRELDNTPVKPPASPIQHAPEVEEVLGIEDLE